MVAQLDALCLDAREPLVLARFWAGLLGWEAVQDAVDGVWLRPTDGTGFRLRLRPTSEPKVVQNRMHLDLTSSSLEDQAGTVARALQLGGRHVDVGQTAEDGHVVLGDPEGNELCVIEPGNRFLADCGFVGALACDGSRQVGEFWSAALGWPLVWDQGQETAIRSPHGGPKITWGGPPFRPATGGDRLRFELSPGPDDDQLSELGRLLDLGATRVDADPAEAGAVLLADPDGGVFRLLDRPGGRGAGTAA